MPAEGTRRRLLQYYSFDHAVELLQRSSNIVILTGAGISTSVGIPDFRSEDGGIYPLLKKQGFSDPEDLFHIDSFNTDANGFYRVLNCILPPEDVRISPTHAFIKLVQDLGKLLTNYTQNIDQLEEQAGIDSKHIIHCHGTLAPGKCITCGHRVKAKYFLPFLRKCQKVGAPRCRVCDQKPPGSGKTVPKSKKRKRGEWEDDGSEEENRGIIKPNIVFYGERVADSLSPRLAEDILKMDLLLIIGTSLKVAPVSNILVEIPSHVPQIHISLKRCQMRGVTPDIELLGECDVIVEELARRAGWKLKHEMIPDAPEAVSIETLEGSTNKHIVRRLKPPPAKFEERSKIPQEDTASVHR